MDPSSPLRSPPAPPPPALDVVAAATPGIVRSAGGLCLFAGSISAAEARARLEEQGLSLGL